MIVLYCLKQVFKKWLAISFSQSREYESGGSRVEKWILIGGIG
jgi:hypothetical protein